MIGSFRPHVLREYALPADPHRVVILRRIEAVDGPARVNVVLDVRAGFGRSRMTGLSRAGGHWSGRSGAIRFRWSGAAKARPGADGLALTVTLPAGGHYDLVLELSDRPLDTRPPDPGEAWAATEESWSAVVPGCGDLIAAHDARHAYAGLPRLCARRGPGSGDMGRDDGGRATAAQAALAQGTRRSRPGAGRRTGACTARPVVVTCATGGTVAGPVA
jgi:alpha,alpha-trehalase